MAVLFLANADIYAGQLDLSGVSHKLTLNAKADELDATVFGATYRARVGGLKDTTVQHEGFVDYSFNSGNPNDPDTATFTALGAQRVFTVSPTGADGATAYFFNATRFTYAPLDVSVGDLTAFSGEASASDGVGLIRGIIGFPKQAVSGAVNGTAWQVGAVSAGQKLYTAIHCFPTVGTTVTVIVESAAASNMVGATTRSSTVVNALGGTFVAPVAGPITDPWWRVRTASVTGTFTLAVAVGIQ